MEWHIIGILAFIVIYNLYRYYHEDNDNDYCPVTATTPENNHIEETRMEETISTRQLALFSGLKRDSAKSYLDSLCKGDNPRLWKVRESRRWLYFPKRETSKE